MAEQITTPDIAPVEQSPGLPHKETIMIELILGLAIPLLPIMLCRWWRERRRRQWTAWDARGWPVPIVHVDDARGIYTVEYPPKNIWD